MLRVWCQTLVACLLLAGATCHCIGCKRRQETAACMRFAEGAAAATTCSMAAGAVHQHMSSQGSHIGTQLQHAVCTGHACKRSNTANACSCALPEAHQALATRGTAAGGAAPCWQPQHPRTHVPGCSTGTSSASGSCTPAGAAGKSSQQAQPANWPCTQR